jgi:hypothetical protein
MLHEFQNLHPVDPKFESTIKTLMDSLSEHIKEEENDDLPWLEKSISKDESASKAKEFERTKMFVPTRSHPSAPDKPVSGHERVWSRCTALTLSLSRRSSDCSLPRSTSSATCSEGSPRIRRALQPWQETLGDDDDVCSVAVLYLNMPNENVGWNELVESGVRSFRVVVAAKTCTTPFQSGPLTSSHTVQNEDRPTVHDPTVRRREGRPDDDTGPTHRGPGHTCRLSSV